jgi:ferric-dicitrate binding protein FerR (iron transport regulator)
MMDCRDLTNDRLTGPAEPAVRDHLEACAACRERRRELQDLEAGLAALGRALPRREHPALVRRIVARIPRPAAASNAGLRWGAGLAAAAALLFAIVLATRRTPSTPRPEIAEALPSPSVEAPPEPAVEVPVPAPAPPAPAPRPKPADPLPRPPAPVTVPKTAPPAPPPAAPAVPRPVDVPRTPPPAESRPARVLLTLTAIEGALELQEGGSWKKISQATAWDRADALRAGDRTARFTLPDGTRATLRPHGELRLLVDAPPSLSLERGEVFFEVVPGRDRRFSVATPDARIEVTGTQFSVRRGDRTEILVTSGEVRVSNEKGEVRVPAGTGTSARKGSAPARPRIVDADRATAWRRELDGVETPRFRYDFENGRLPYPWSNGKVVAGPARGLNRFCLQGGPGTDANLARLDPKAVTLRGTLKLRLRYWTAGADALWVQLFNDRVGDNFRFDVKAPAHGKWEALELPVADFARLADGSHPQEGDRFTWLNVSVSGPAGAVYFDDIELVEVRK